MVAEFLRKSDVLLGPFDDSIFQARAAQDRHIPYVCFLLGTMSRGAFSMIKSYQHLTTGDILVGNCAADLKLAHKFFVNAQTRLLPFAFDESNYYPIDEAEKRAIRAQFGFRPEEKIIVYAGRITLEKNVHSVVRVFSAVRRLVPTARLVIAGLDVDYPFYEFGGFTFGIRNTLVRAAARLGLSKEQVTLVGRRNADELRALYNIADVAVNLTLHHDENFGLSQVEAMACGTPVVGTSWGGLKDTIVDGETGYKVDTVVTGTGVKVNWWQAVNHIVTVLGGGPEQSRLRPRCRANAYDRYSLTRYGQHLESILSDCRAAEATAREPLKSSPFARHFWGLCAPQWGEPPSYRRSPRSYQMYRELIAPFAGSSPGPAAAGELDPQEILCLANPLLIDGRTLAINDPIFAFELEIPEAHRAAVLAVLEVLKEEPAITWGRLARTRLPAQADLPGALAWMLDTGLLLKGGTGPWPLTPRDIAAQMSVPVFTIQSMSHTTDAMVVGP
jgi:glycosyltransferase involved in cell wall biosynthesis